MQFIPAPLTNSIVELKRQLKSFLPFFERVGVDIVDNSFNSQTTYQIHELIDEQALWLSEGTEKLTYDFDLMVEDWDHQLEKMRLLAGHISINTVFIHTQTLRNKPYPIDKNFPFAIGLAFDPKDEIEDLASHVNLNHIKSIQIMTVQSGAQGRDIIPELLNKIGVLRNKNYSGKIYIDGGVNEQNLQVILAQKYLPDFAYVGSYLSHAENDLARRVSFLKSLEMNSTVEGV